MTAIGKVTIGFDVREIGSVDWNNIIKKFNLTATPDAKFYNIVEQTTADSDEAIAAGDIASIEYMVVHCITNDIDLDLNFVGAFKANAEVQEGEWACFKPSGTVYFKNNDAGEKGTFEYWLIGQK